MQGLGTFEGIASGLNTTQLVDAIITAERAPARLLEARRDQRTRELTTFSSLEALLLAFKTETARLAKATTFDVSQSSVSDPTVLDASAPGLVGSATYDIEVRKLATAHQIASQGYASLSDVVGTGTFTIQVGSGSAVTVTLDETHNTLADLRDKINDSNAAVKAAIINDGSPNAPYRLVLTGTSTGLANRIKVTSGLAGGDAVDFSTSRFDAPEVMIKGDTTTSSASLGPTASYSGAANKIYTFTVAGTGAQTVGQSEIAIDWTDGTNSGRILVSQADTEVMLSGAGADGLRISLSAGDLTGGDVFQVQTFAPQLQAAQDAEVAVGTSGNGGTPLVLRNSTNKLVGALPGLTLALKKTTATGEKVTVTVGPATENVKTRITDFVDKYNKLIEAVDKQFQYDPNAQTGGTLLGDSSLLFIQTRLRTRIGQMVPGLEGALRTLRDLGIRTGSDGQLTVDGSTLAQKIEDSWEDVRRLFSYAGRSSREGIVFVSAGGDSKPSDSGYAVDITQAAARGYYQGREIADPAVTPITISEDADQLTVSVDGVTSNPLTLAAKSYASGDALAAELQAKIDADEKLAGRGIAVTFEGEAGQGHLRITSGSYGSSSTVTVASGGAADTLGLSGASAVKGLDVEGTINGERATGTGQLLTGEDENPNTSGIVLRIELSGSDLVAGSEGSISFSRGLAASMDAELELLTQSDSGFVSARKKGIQAQIDDLSDQVERFDQRLLIRRNALLKKFAAMEEALSQFQSQSSYLTTAIASLNSNFRLSGMTRNK
jgi:flagellar hook-associated protein 2